MCTCTCTFSTTYTCTVYAVYLFQPTCIVSGGMAISYSMCKPITVLTCSH